MSISHYNILTSISVDNHKNKRYNIGIKLYNLTLISDGQKRFREIEKTIIIGILYRCCLYTLLWVLHRYFVFFARDVWYYYSIWTCQIITSHIMLCRYVFHYFPIIGPFIIVHLGGSIMNCTEFVTFAIGARV